MIVKASYAQHWNGYHYDKNERMKGKDYALQALVKCGRAYIKETDFPASDKLIQAGYDDFENLPDDEELLEVDGIGKATLKKIRDYTEDDCGC